ncbi:hypothetical protein T10_771 [Trichinella papuae]|uniref:Uncharacterized protein n=1 Tax=Trichinella papuae TaxID=268474 RepID=A0A0V1MJW8_9BILA|nr:hypothetical protein T10_771 [Trichinella papuae]
MKFKLSNVELTRIALNWLAAIKGKGQSDWALASQRSGTSGRWHNAEAAVNHGRVAMPQGQWPEKARLREGRSS